MAIVSTFQSAVKKSCLRVTFGPSVRFAEKKAATVFYGLCNYKKR